MDPVRRRPSVSGNVVVVVATGAANTASVCSALQRVGGKPVLSTDPELVSAADRVLLPGVGAFGPAMESLRAFGIAEALRQRFLLGQPTLGICLGLQLLASTSEESPGARGLGIFKTPVARLISPSASRWRIPNMGWRRVAVGPQPLDQSTVPGLAYYANSYALDAERFCALDGDLWATAITRFAERDFVALAQRRSSPLALACQFHPELSGPGGQRFLAAWLDGSLGSIEGPPDQRDADRTNRVSSLPLARNAVETPPPRRIIPCMDVRDGRIVKGVRFDNLRDAGDPARRAEFYQRAGADELVMLDVSAGPEGRRACLATIESIRQRIGLPLCVGGGVRTTEDAKAMLDAGADKVAVNSAAVSRPELISELANCFGSQCVVLAIDAQRQPGGAYQVVVASGKRPTERLVPGWVTEGTQRGAGEILLTAIDRDGTGLGYDAELLRSVTQACRVPVIASGGGRTAQHMADAFSLGGADAVLAASIFHDDEAETPERSELAKIKGELVALGVLPPESLPVSLFASPDPGSRPTEDSRSDQRNQSTQFESVP